MGEIKSTLDLVMEKTRHLSLSEEEKKEQRYLTVNKNVKGLLQKYEDGILDADQMKKELNALQKTYNLNAEKIMKTEIVDRINFDNKSGRLLNLLKGTFGINTNKIASVLNEYQTTVREASLKLKDTMKKTLFEKHFISGSAVIPNLAANDHWLRELTAIRTKFDQIMGQEKANLKVL